MLVVFLCTNGPRTNRLGGSLVCISANSVLVSSAATKLRSDPSCVCVSNNISALKISFYPQTALKGPRYWGPADQGSKILRGKQEQRECPNKWSIPVIHWALLHLLRSSCSTYTLMNIAFLELEYSRRRERVILNSADNY